MRVPYHVDKLTVARRLAILGTCSGVFGISYGVGGGPLTNWLPFGVFGVVAIAIALAIRARVVAAERRVTTLPGNRRKP